MLFPTAPAFQQLALAHPDLSEDSLAAAQSRMQLAADLLRSVREERAQIESERAAAAARARELQAALRAAHEQLMQQRQERIESSADQVGGRGFAELVLRL